MKCFCMFIFIPMLICDEIDVCMLKLIHDFVCLYALLSLFIISRGGQDLATRSKPVISEVFFLYQTRQTSVGYPNVEKRLFWIEKGRFRIGTHTHRYPSLTETVTLYTSGYTWYTLLNAQQDCRGTTSAFTAITTYINTPPHFISPLKPLFFFSLATHFSTTLSQLPLSLLLFLNFISSLSPSLTFANILFIIYPSFSFFNLWINLWKKEAMKISETLFLSSY